MQLQNSAGRKDLIANIPHGELGIYQAALIDYKRFAKAADLEIGPGSSGCSHAVYLNGPRSDLSLFWQIHAKKDKAPRAEASGHITNIHPQQLKRFKAVLDEYLLIPKAARLKIGPGRDGYEYALHWDGPEKNMDLFWQMYAPKWIEAGATKTCEKKKTSKTAIGKNDGK
jgi:hypothetical protein